MIFSDEFVLLISGLAVAMSQDKTSLQVDLLAAIFVQLGETMNTIAVQRRILEERQGDSPLPPEGTDFLP